MEVQSFPRPSNISHRRGSQEIREEKQVRLSVISDEMPRRIRRDSSREGEVEDGSGLRYPVKANVELLESLPEQKRRKSSIKPAKLNLQTLKEHQSELSAQSPSRQLSNQQRAHRRRTITDTTMTDISTDSGSRDRSLSLYSTGISARAQRVTRRLSVASFSKGLLEGRLNALKPPGEINYENTYKMEAEEKERFRPGQAKKLMEGLLENTLEDLNYSPALASQISCDLSNEIKVELRQLQNIPRYKVICHVTIGQKNGQGFQIASRCLWDTNSDNSACAIYENQSLFAIALAFGVYFE